MTKFESFLIKHNARQEFIQETIRRGYPINDLNKYILDFSKLHDKDCIHIIDVSIYWSGAPSGYAFWSRLNNVWNIIARKSNHIRKLNKNTKVI